MYNMKFKPLPIIILVYRKVHRAGKDNFDVYRLYCNKEGPAKFAAYSDQETYELKCPAYESTTIKLQQQTKATNLYM